MTGQVTGRQIRVKVPVRMPVHPDLAIKFVVDTGFQGFLTLPPSAIAALGLPLLHDLAARLADDSLVRVDVHSATILWDGEEREVPVLALGKRPLLGTSLLDGNEAFIQFTDGGIVTIERL